MTNFLSPKPPARVYRVDKFHVPDSAYGEFLAQLRATHQFLRTLPGFVADHVLEKTDGPGAFNFVTIAIWENADAVVAAKAAVVEWCRLMDFDPREMLARLGIEADLATYEAIDGETASTPAPVAELAEISSS